MDMNGDSNVDSRPFLFGGLSPNFLSAVSRNNALDMWNLEATWMKMHVYTQAIWNLALASKDLNHEKYKICREWNAEEDKKDNPSGVTFSRIFFGVIVGYRKWINSPGPVAQGSRMVFSFQRHQLNEPPFSISMVRRPGEQKLIKLAIPNTQPYWSWLTVTRIFHKHVNEVMYIYIYIYQS